MDLDKATRDNRCALVALSGRLVEMVAGRHGLNGILLHPHRRAKKSGRKRRAKKRKKSALL